MRLGVVAAIAAAAAFAAPAVHAADADMMPASANWTGCYVGGNIGGAWDSTKVVDEVDGSPIASLSSSAIIGGGQVGCDYQLTPQWVIGAQGLWDATGLRASYTETDRAAPLYPNTLTGNVPWVATFTGRVGYLAAPNFLIYAKGGLAWNQTNAAILDSGTLLTKTSFNQTGWTAGIGAEWKVNPRWSFFGEYDYMGFGTTTVSFPGTGDLGNVKQNIQALLFGVNFHLN